MCAKKNTKARKNAPAKSNAIKIVCENRKARFDYQLHERFEAGLVLTGSEVKSLRLGKANLTNAYGDIHNAEAYLVQAEIQLYDKGGYANHEPLRRRKLLLHREEINKLLGKTQAKGFTVVPLKIYFKNGRAKIELALASGKKTHDKRATIKERETQRDLQRSMRKY